MFNLRKLVVFFLVLIIVFIFFKRDIFTFFQGKANKQETVSLKTTNEEKLDSKVVIKKSSETSSLDTITLEKGYVPQYNEDAYVQNIEVMSEELIALETLAKQNNELDNVEPNASDVTPQELLDMEYSVSQGLKEESVPVVDTESSGVTPQELLDVEYFFAQKLKKEAGLVGVKSSKVTPQELLDMENHVKKEGKMGNDLVQLESLDVTPE